MVINLFLHPDLIDRALEVSGERTKKAAITRALEEFIARRGQKRLIELMGKLADTSVWSRALRRDHRARAAGTGPGLTGARFIERNYAEQPRPGRNARPKDR